jgi:deoxycytidine triphosphate deaminase
MLGNPLTDALILQYRKDRRIRISPFDDGQLDPCAYALTPDEFAFEELSASDEPMPRRWSLERDGDRPFPAHEYAIVTVVEQVVLGDGMMGLFVPQSELIEAGFSLTCGKLDPGYGEGGEQIRFGIQNARSRENLFRTDMSLAHLLFFDVSGSPTLRVELDDREKRLWRRRLRENLLADAEDDEGLRDLVSGSHQGNFE